MHEYYPYSLIAVNFSEEKKRDVFRSSLIFCRMRKKMSLETRPKAKKNAYL